MPLQLPQKLQQAVLELTPDRLGSLLKIAEKASQIGVLEINSTELEALLGFAKEKTDQITKELEEKGFLTRVQNRNEQGQFENNTITLKVIKI